MSDLAKQVVGWTVGINAVAHAIRLLWRRVSRDRVLTATDRAEQSLLHRLEKYAVDANERADSMAREMHQTMRQNAELTGQVFLLQRQVSALTAEVRQLRAELGRDSSAPNEGEKQ